MSTKFPWMSTKFPSVTGTESLLNTLLMLGLLVRLMTSPSSRQFFIESCLQQGIPQIVKNRKNGQRYRTEYTITSCTLNYVLVKWGEKLRGQKESLWMAVREITWISDESVHLGKWMTALEQVTVGHLVKCTHHKFLILIGGTCPSGMHRHSAK